LGKVIDRIKKGALVRCGEQFIGKVNRIVKDPEYKRTDFFSIEIKDKEVLLPIEIIYKATEEALILNADIEQIESLPDIKGKEVCNQAGYIFHDLKEVIYRILDIARPYLDYY
jgi:hypothetical protein